MATAPGGVAQISPSKGLGFLTLGASLFEVVNRLRSYQRVYPSINMVYDANTPLTSTVVIDLSANGIRLRFDGADQRLRLIEVVDFEKARVSYNGSELVKSDSGAPSFRSIYNRLFGPTFPGEYMAEQGTYVLSYPGVAFSFPLERNQWSEKVDFVSLLSSSVAQPASSMAIFAGASWAESRNELFKKTVTTPRRPIVNAQSARTSTANDEIELVRIHADTRIELVRRHNAPFWITLNSTTTQDLIAELGPPTSIYRKNDHRLSIHRTPSNGGLGLHPPPQNTAHEYSSEEALSDQEDDDSGGNGDGSEDHFYNYFHHGFDIFISTSSSVSSSLSHVATKIILHGNIPGSFEFQRYRRARWTIEYCDTPSFKDPLTSEMGFDDILGRLREKFASGDGAPKPMLLNRASDSPSSSCEMLGGWEEGDEGRRQGDRNEVFGNTELYGFPGLIFEVFKEKAVSTLTVF